MGGVQHQVKAFPAEQVLHFLAGQPFGGDVYFLGMGEQGLPVFCGYAGGDGHRLRSEKFHHFPAFRGPGKNADLIHPGILWA